VDLLGITGGHCVPLSVLVFHSRRATLLVFRPLRTFGLAPGAPFAPALHRHGAHTVRHPSQRPCNYRSYCGQSLRQCRATCPKKTKRLRVGKIGDAPNISPQILVTASKSEPHRAARLASWLKVTFLGAKPAAQFVGVRWRMRWPHCLELLCKRHPWRRLHSVPSVGSNGMRAQNSLARVFASLREADAAVAFTFSFSPARGRIAFLCDHVMVRILL